LRGGDASSPLACGIRPLEPVAACKVQLAWSAILS
jgi:hypothetical protein